MVATRKGSFALERANGWAVAHTSRIASRWLLASCLGACNDAGKAAGTGASDEARADLTPSGLKPARTFDPPATIDGWTPVSLAPASLPRDAGFGTAVAASGNVVVVGAPGRAGFTGVGTVHVFERKGASWAQIAALSPAGLASGSQFGRAVAIDGDTIVVGSHGVHVIERKPEGWTEVATLAVPSWEQDRHVSALGIAGSTIVVGNPDRRLDDSYGAGAVAVFERGPEGWRGAGELMASDAKTLAGKCQANFGNAVAIADGVLVVGARQAEVDGVEMSGAGYIFERIDGAWREVLRLPAKKAQPWSAIGHAVATDGERVAFALTGPRSVWVLVKEDGEWRDFDSVDAAYQLASGDDEVFGSRVAIRGSRVAVGVLPTGKRLRPPVKPGTNELDLDALERMRAPRAGAVQLHVRALDGAWARGAELSRAPSEIGDELGMALAFGDDFLVAGAPRARIADDGSDVGDAVVFAAPGG